MTIDQLIAELQRLKEEGVVQGTTRVDILHCFNLTDLGGEDYQGGIDIVRYDEVNETVVLE